MAVDVIAATGRSPRARITRVISATATNTSAASTSEPARATSPACWYGASETPPTTVPTRRPPETTSTETSRTPFTVRDGPADDVANRRAAAATGAAARGASTARA